MTWSPKRAMKKAIQLAEKGIGCVEPNPPVGCVILDRDFQFLSSGYHAKYGEDHAEVQALKKISNKARLKGAHVFVTLEPCHHLGKTPPCSLALSCYPIQSVTYGTSDPISKGEGLEHLKSQGVEIKSCPWFQKELESLVEKFKFSYINKQPFVSLKVASSLDGVIARYGNQRTWITSEKTRNHAQLLRASHSAVLIGVNTLLKDNPFLNIRLKKFKNKKTHVIILDPLGESFDFLPQSNLLKTHTADHLLIVSADIRKTPGQQPFQLLKAPLLMEKNNNTLPARQNPKRDKQQIKSASNKIFQLSFLLKKLYREYDIQSLVVEGGAFCFSEFINQQQVQKLHLYIAPFIMGSGLRWTEFLNPKNPENKIPLHSIHQRQISTDFLLEGYFHFS